MHGFAGYWGKTAGKYKRFFHQGLKKHCSGKKFERNFDICGVQAISQLSSDVFYPKTKSATSNVAFLGDFINDEDEISRNIGETVFEIHSKHGIMGLQDLTGCFAYAIFDRINNQLVLSRGNESSPMLWLYKTPEGFVFSSSFGVFQEIDDVLHIGNSGMLQYLLFDGVSQGSTFFEGLQALKPNEIRVFETGNEFTLKISDEHEMFNFLEINDVSEIAIQTRERLKSVDDSTLFLTGEGSDLLLSQLAPDNCRRILLFTDKYQLFPESMPEKIKDRTGKLANLFSVTNANSKFEEITVTIGDDSSKNPGAIVFDALKRFTRINPYPQASLNAFKNFILVDKLNLKNRTNIVNTSSFDVILQNKLRKFKPSTFYITVNNWFNIFGKDANSLISQVKSLFLKVFDKFLLKTSDAENLENTTLSENRFSEYIENLNLYNEIHADWILPDGFSNKSTLNHISQEYQPTEINVLKSFEEVLNCRFVSPLDLDIGFVPFPNHLFAYKDRKFWRVLSSLMKPLDLTRSKWREYQGKRWLLDYTQKHWQNLLKAPKILEYEIISKRHLQHVYKEYEKANIQDVEALYNIVLLELWLVENEV